ncbi:MAG TPA: A24 family peptidase [Candidatus Eisenbacteria bacterium]
MVHAQWAAGGAVLLCCAAAWSDLRTRRVPNALLLPAFVGALCLHSVPHAGQGLLLSLAGAAAAGALLLPGYALRFTGAGDVKLLVAVGAWLAFPAALAAGLLSLLVGGLLGLAVAASKSRLREVLGRAFRLGRWLAHRAANVPLARPEVSGLRVPFGVAVAVATALVVWSP